MRPSRAKAIAIDSAVPAMRRSAPPPRRPDDGMPHLVRFLLRHALIGLGLASAFVAYLLLANVGGLGDLVLNSPDRIVVTAVLIAGMTITFSSVQMGIAVMLLGTSGRD
jgi:hypothetical protein